MMNDNRRILLDFHGKVAVITGAARGLGREYALLLASRGASIIGNSVILRQSFIQLIYFSK